MKRIYIVLLAFVFVSLAGVGCVSIGTVPQGNDGGVWRSIDKGVTWAQINTVPTVKGIGNMNGIDSQDLVLDPMDNKAIYLASTGNGLFYTWDSGATWKFAENLGMGYVNSIAVAYDNKCVIYLAVQNRIIKTIDCGRSWQNYYFDTRANLYVSYVATSPFDANLLYAGLSTGDLLKSTDKGVSWTTINRFNNKIQKIYVHPKTANLMFIGLQNEGLRRSADNGKTWTDLRPKMSEFGGSNEIYDIDMDKDGKTIFLTTNYGIITSEDKGDSWKKVELLTPPNGTKIYALAVNPLNSKEIYYSTATTFYSSFDGGKSWVTKKLPTVRAGSVIVVDPINPNIIYMGTKKLD